MFDRSTMTDDECSPWPPVLQFCPEVRSGIEAATALAFGRHWDTPMCEMTPEALLLESELLRDDSEVTA